MNSVSPAVEQYDLLKELILAKTCVVGVVGLGYVGLPLTRTFINSDVQVFGFDIDEQKITALNSGKSYIQTVDNATVGQWLEKKKFRASASRDDLKQADVLIICVPTPLDQSLNPDLSYVTSTTEMIASILRPGQLVVLESTTYPGTTRDVLLPILEKSGLECGKDFFLAYSPEREDPGNKVFSTGDIPKVVGGIEPKSTDLANELYTLAIVRTVPVSSCEVAEASKILENTYRCINIALVNELKKLFIKMDIDIWEVIEAAKTKPFGFQAFYPGPGLGGHCIPIDPFYLSWVAKKFELPTRFIELAGEVNTEMPRFVIQRVFEAMNANKKTIKDSRICVVGLAYKKDIDDDRESPSYELIKSLIQFGAEVFYHDPHIPRMPEKRHYDLPRMVSQELTAEFIQSMDCLIVSTDHSAIDWDLVYQHANLVVDCRNVYPKTSHASEKIWSA